MKMLPVNTWAVATLGLLLVAGLGASHWTAYRAGQRSEIARQASVTKKHEAKVESQNQNARAVSQETGHAIEAQRNERSREADRARDVIGPVRVCNSAGAEVPRVPNATAAAHGTEAEAQLPLRAGEPAEAAGGVPGDIGPGLIALIKACQGDHDDEQTWREWWAAEKALATPAQP